VLRTSFHNKLFSWATIAYVQGGLRGVVSFGKTSQRRHRSELNHGRGDTSRHENEGLNRGSGSERAGRQQWRRPLATEQSDPVTHKAPQDLKATQDQKGVEIAEHVAAMAVTGKLQVRKRSNLS
jgi:hypothetical protein